MQLETTLPNLILELNLRNGFALELLRLKKFSYKWDFIKHLSIVIGGSRALDAGTLPVFQYLTLKRTLYSGRSNLSLGRERARVAQEPGKK